MPGANQLAGVATSARALFRSRRLLAGVAGGLALHCPLLAVARGETRHVLVLSSSERPFAPQSGFADALVKELIRSSREPIHLVEVSVQAARASGETPDASIAQRIRSASGSHRLDLVITIGGPAATFAQQFRQELFPATPTLIAGVDHRFVENGTFTDNETTVATHHEPALMIDEILRLLPETRTVMVVVGASHVEQFWLQEMKREFRRFGGRLQFNWTNELSFDEIVERSRTMPAQSAIFFAILSLDGKGEPRVEADAVTSLHAAANVPMFALHGRLMGRGLVGGPMVSADELSRTTTQVALRVLAGESPGSIKTPTQRTGQPTYDARELRRWKIRREPAPAGQRRAVPRADDLAALSASDHVRRGWWDPGRRDCPARRPHQSASRPEPRTDCEGRSHAGTCGCDGQGVDRGRRWPARGSRPCSRRRAARLVDGLRASR